ncbi:MAG: DsbA family protein [Solirubrobacterales bacterium]
MNSRTIEYFFSFRSPYSYISGPRAFALADRYDVEIKFRGVLPMMMRGQSVPRAKALNTLRDVDREAKRLGMPFGRIHDPLGDAAVRCLVVSELAKDQNREREFVLAASRMIWAEAVDMATDDGLRLACDEAGLEWNESRAALDDPELMERVQKNTDDLAALDLWGVPVFNFAGERFWGQDRIEDLETLLRETGLERV